MSGGIAAQPVGPDEVQCTDAMPKNESCQPDTSHVPEDVHAGNRSAKKQNSAMNLRSFRCRWEKWLHFSSRTRFARLCKQKRSLVDLYYSQIQLTHLLAPFPFWRPLIPLTVALLRLVPFPIARMKNSLRILCHFHLRIVLLQADTNKAVRLPGECPEKALCGAYLFISLV